MAFIYMLITGFIVGLLARALKPGRDNLGLLMTTLLGIAGAIIAGFFGQSMGWYLPGEPAGILASILGAIVLLVLVDAASRRRRIL
jgi:uncharacterized membrane protein YeaQ/YmgE (transglycosylase-associated protein family)